MAKSLGRWLPKSPHDEEDSVTGGTVGHLFQANGAHNPTYVGVTSVVDYDVMADDSNHDLMDHDHE